VYSVYETRIVLAVFFYWTACFDYWYVSAAFLHPLSKQEVT